MVKYKIPNLNSKISSIDELNLELVDIEDMDSGINLALRLIDEDMETIYNLLDSEDYSDMLIAKSAIYVLREEYNLTKSNIKSLRDSDTESFIGSIISSIMKFFGAILNFFKSLFGGKSNSGSNHTSNTVDAIDIVEVNKKDIMNAIETIDTITAELEVTGGDDDKLKYLKESREKIISNIMKFMVISVESIINSLLLEELDTLLGVNPLTLLSNDYKKYLQVFGRVTDISKLNYSIDDLPKDSPIAFLDEEEDRDARYLLVGFSLVDTDKDTNNIIIKYLKVHSSCIDKSNRFITNIESKTFTKEMPLHNDIIELLSLSETTVGGDVTKELLENVTKGGINFMLTIRPRLIKLDKVYGKANSELIKLISKSERDINKAKDGAEAILSNDEYFDKFMLKYITNNKCLDIKDYKGGKIHYSKSILMPLISASSSSLKTVVFNKKAVKKSNSLNHEILSLIKNIKKIK